MRKITKFEDIEAWQDARVVAKTVYSITEKWKDFALRDQIRRAQEDFLLMYEDLDKVQRKLSVFIKVLRNNATTL